jgi:hypothetical protein
LELPYYRVEVSFENSFYLQTLALPASGRRPERDASGELARTLRAQRVRNLKATEIELDASPEGCGLKYFSTARA